MQKGTIQLAHGGGGRLTRDLIASEIIARFGEDALQGLPDAAQLSLQSQKILFSTDSFVVQPLFFPGGDIGHLAVHGTVNDIAASGGHPRWLSLAMILEEGLELTILQRVLDSVQAAAAECGVMIVTGDTKVVQRGQCDKLYLNTAGIGEALPGFDLQPARLTPGDRVLASGCLGDHGVAVMTAREQLDIREGPQSDTAPVHRLVLALRDIASSVKLMRDPTRGGAAAVLNEWVADSLYGVTVQEEKLPFSPAGRAVAEMLGLDLLHVASEGRLLAVVAAEQADAALAAWHSLPEGTDARVFGTISTEKGRVVMETNAGGRRMIDLPQGELLPRIC